MHVQHTGTGGKLKRKHTNKYVIRINKVAWHFCDTSKVLASFTATITIFFSVLFTVGAFRDPLHQNWFLITAVTRFVDHIICLLTASISHIYPSFQACFAVNKQIGLRSGEIASARYSKTNLADKVDLEHLSMTTMEIKSNNNSENNVTVSQSDKDQGDLTFLIIKSRGFHWKCGPILYWCRSSRVPKLDHFTKKVIFHLFHRRFLQHVLPFTFDPRNLWLKHDKTQESEVNRAGWFLASGASAKAFNKLPNHQHVPAVTSFKWLLFFIVSSLGGRSLFFLEAFPWRRHRWLRCHFPPRE